MRKLKVFERYNCWLHWQKCTKSEIKTKIHEINEMNKRTNQTPCSIYKRNAIARRTYTKHNRIEPVKAVNSESSRNSNDTRPDCSSSSSRSSGSNADWKENRKSLLVAGLTSLLEWFLSLDYRNFTIFTDEFCTGRYFRRICLIHKVHCHLSSVCVCV